MLPAYQGLESNRPAALKAHLRLVKDRELPLLQGPPQIGFGFEAREGASTQILIEHVVFGRSVVLGIKHRQVRVSQQLVYAPILGALRTIPMLAVTNNSRSSRTK